jgi:putative polyhydroxyalkanoate system protein
MRRGVAASIQHAARGALSKSAARNALRRRVPTAPDLAILPRAIPKRGAMSTISISRRHHLTHKKAKDVAEKIAKDLKKRFDLEYAWEGDHVDFERPGVSGRMLVGKDEIRLQARLGFLLAMLKPVLENEINKQLDALIGKPDGRGKSA